MGELTDEQLDELSRLIGNAAPGPWYEHGDEDVYGDNGPVCTPFSDADARLIVAMRNALPALIAAARRCEALDIAMRELASDIGAAWIREVEEE